MKMFPPMRAPQNGRFTKNNNQYAITPNKKTRDNKENIHEFNFEATKNKGSF
jgi:hypothetical protein